jgi:ribosomal subunit interface protein
MDLVVKGREITIPDQFRATAAAKLAKIARLAPRGGRLEIEVTPARSARPNGLKRLDATLDSPGRVFRARGDGPDLEAALEQLVSRLERQLRDHRGRRRDRLHGRTDRLKSAPIGRRRGPRAE